MTYGTACKHIPASYTIIILKVNSFFCVQIVVFPLHIVDLRFWSDKFFRLLVARQAPFHLQCIFLIDRRHIVYLAVAGRTPDTFCDVYAVVKICIFRKIVNAFPFDRLVISITGSDRFQIWTVSPDLAVAVHTGLG